jgi:uncharacterized protein
MTELEENCLSMDEYEAIRLADFEGLYQEEAAKRMNISRQTFGNIIESAHRKIADAIVNAKALKIEGGVIKMLAQKFVCLDCHHQWNETEGTEHPHHCYKCRSGHIRHISEEVKESLETNIN